MGVYEPRGPLETRDLNQGDILSGVLRAKLPAGEGFALQRSAKVQYPAPPEYLAHCSSELRLICKVERIDALVISNSCDNCSGLNPILLAPVKKFKFRDGIEAAGDRWLDISEAATGTADAKAFYLPGEPRFGLERSEAILTDIFPVSHSLLTRAAAEADTRRVCGLTTAAIRHLQWALNQFLSRDPREDHEWPSEEDLRLKLAWLDQVIPNSDKRRRERYEQDRERVGALLAEPLPAPSISMTTPGAVTVVAVAAASETRLDSMPVPEDGVPDAVSYSASTPGGEKGEV